MKKVVLVILVVVAALVIVLQVSPPGRFGSGATITKPGSFVTVIDSLAPQRTVKPADVVGQTCWDDQGVLTVSRGGSCRTPLPAKANRLRMCTLDGPFLAIVVTGVKHPPQAAKVEEMNCPIGTRVNLYDRENEMVASCAPVASLPPCRLKLL